MKNFIKNLAFFFIPIIILAFPLDHYMSKKIAESNSFAYGHGYIWKDIYDGNLNADILIYGSSRASTQIDPQLFGDNLGQSCYNLGLEGHNFWLSEFRHQEILKYNKKPKHIILSLDTFSLEKRPDLFNYEQFLPYMLFNASILKATSGYESFSDYDFYIPLLRYVGEREAWKETFVPKKTPFHFREKGFNPIDATWNDDFENAKKNQKIYEIKKNAATIKKLYHFIKDCRAKNIDLIFIYTPEYMDGQNFVKDRKELLDFYKKTATENGIVFLDYSENSISMDKKYFVNSQHLNRTGATLFTKKLATDLKEHILKN